VITLHERISRIVEHSLPGTLIPVSSLRKLLEHNSPEPRTVADPGLSLMEIAQRCAARGRRSKPVATATVRSWIRNGLRGVKLQAFPWGRTYRVTEEALDRFLRALQKVSTDAAKDLRGEVPAVTQGTIKKEIEAARDRYSRVRKHE
jgi:hypothetical protein